MWRNKAVATERRLLHAPWVISYPEYFNQGNAEDIFMYLLDEPTLVIASVDNAMSRHVLLKEVEQAFNEFIWVCPSNSLHTSQVSVYVKVKGCEPFVHPFELYNNLANPTDSIPTDGGCENESVSSPQLIGANMQAALQTIQVVTCLLDEQPVFPLLIGDVYLNTCSGQGTPVVIKRGE